MANEHLESDKLIRASVLQPTFNEKTYEYNDKFEPSNNLDVSSVHTTAELVALLERNPNIGLDSIVLSMNPKSNKYGFKRLGKEQFVKAFKEGEHKFKGVKLKESSDDAFASDQNTANTGLIGDDFIPTLGGPFYKNLYFYDYIRMHNLGFWAVHHDPIARAYVNIMRDFTLGRGFRVDSDNKTAVAYWRAFEEVNNLQGMMDSLAREISTYGETMIWKLPENQTKIVQKPYPGQPVDRGVIPRVRLVDPSVIWEIVTWPEDITKVLYYVWVAPTQWQIYTGLDAGNSMVPSSKFIFQTIPADQIRHYKVNSMSNEKRGRSDLFPVLGFMKRMRDSINFELASLQKQAAWSIDTTVEGAQRDVDNYISQMNALGTVAPAGSEFVHTSKIKREFLSAQGTSRGSNQSFEWNMSMIATGLGVPISYFGTHMSGGQTRASAIVATEPVAKKFEMRQQLYENIIKDLWNDVMKYFGIEDADCEVTFPEIIAQDRTAKLKDLALCELQGWISKERAATIAAKELGVTEYEFEDEQADIAADITPIPIPTATPLTSPGLWSSQAKPQTPAQASPSAVTGTEKKDIKTNNGY